MMNTEQLTRQWASGVAKHLHYSEDQRDVMAYGLFAIVHTLMAVGVTALVGLLAGVIIEALLVSFAIAILRKASGGVHASSPGRCLVIGTVICVGGALLSKGAKMLELWYLLILILGLGLWAYWLIGKKVPVDSKAKPITNSAKKERLKKASRHILIGEIVLAITAILYGYWCKETTFYTYSLCIVIGLSWQMITLTKGGEWVIQKLDFLLIDRFRLFKRGEYK